MNDLDSITQEFRQRIDGKPSIGAIIKFAFKEGGVIVVNGGIAPMTVSNDDIPADCTITLAMKDFASMSTGVTSPMLAVMSGKVKVAGDMNKAMKLQPLFK